MVKLLAKKITSNKKRKYKKQNKQTKKHTKSEQVWPPAGSFLKNTCLYSRDSLYDLLNKHQKKQQSINWKYIYKLIEEIKCMLLINIFMLSDGFPMENFCFGFLFFW